MKNKKTLKEYSLKYLMNMIIHSNIHYPNIHCSNIHYLNTHYSNIHYSNIYCSNNLMNLHYLIHYLIFHLWTLHLIFHPIFLLHQKLLDFFNFRFLIISFLKMFNPIIFDQFLVIYNFNYFYVKFNLSVN